MSILILKKIQLRAVFLEKNSLSCEKKIKFPFKIKSKSCIAIQKKDSRKRVLNQTHIVGQVKPEKQIEEVRKIHQKDLDEGFGAVSLPNALDSKYPSGSKNSNGSGSFRRKAAGRTN